MLDSVDLQTEVQGTYGMANVLKMWLLVRLQFAFNGTLTTQKGYIIQASVSMLYV